MSITFYLHLICFSKNEFLFLLLGKILRCMDLQDDVEHEQGLSQVRGMLQSQY